MKKYYFILLANVITSCGQTTDSSKPVSLSEAILTLPSQAVAGIPEEGRQHFLDSPQFDPGPEERRLHLSGDSPDAPYRGECMLFLRLFEDEQGNTIAAAHSARPFADGSTPSDSDTFIFRFVNGKWQDITSAVLPSSASRSWWFRFSEPGGPIPCGPYVEFLRRKDGNDMGYEFGEPGELIELSRGYRFGEPAGELAWEGNRFELRRKANKSE